MSHISLLIYLLPKRYIKRYKIKYLGWLQGETKKLHKIFEDKNLTESVHKYLEITQEDFAYHAKFRMVFEIPSWQHLGFAWCAKFCTGCEISFTHSYSLSCSYWSSSWFCIAMWNSWLLDFFSDSLPCILDWLGKGLWSSKAWILHLIELQLALPWTTQSSPSFLACFNDKKATKNTKTSQKPISNICKGP